MILSKLVLFISCWLKLLLLIGLLGFRIILLLRWFDDDDEELPNGDGMRVWFWWMCGGACKLIWFLFDEVRINLDDLVVGFASKSVGV